MNAMQVVGLALGFVSAAFALAAAVFWYLSARNRLPPMVAYWDGTPDTDPFFVALQAGVKFNRLAAGFAAVSALSGGLATFSSLVHG
jgi:hypothetical protein